ncbi:(2R)-sulfolactate sulfo-lyase subunit beta [Roseovarius sp. A-2]|nr:(2R)-sulfolactate sulfo-lyase subunit beta [Roseovarius sp. A-2]
MTTPLVCYTTGRGSAFESKPSPTIKVATNTEMATRMAEDIDVDAGTILGIGASDAEKGREIYEMFLREASEEAGKFEALGLGDYEFVPWQIGAVM